MQAVILAAGKGTRMGCTTTPKCMLEVNNKPILEHIILQFKSLGITNIVLLVGFCKEKIINYFPTHTS